MKKRNPRLVSAFFWFGVLCLGLASPAAAQIRLGPPAVELVFSIAIDDPVQTSIAINSSDQLGFVYYSEVDQNIYFHQKTLDWQQRVTIDSTGDVGKNLQLRFDSADRPHVAYRRDDETVLADRYPLYAFRSGTIPTGAWQTPERIDSNPDRGNFIRLGLETDGTPHVIYRDQGAVHSAWYARRAGPNTWVREQVTTTDRTRMSLILDTNDQPHVSFRNGSPHQLLYTTRTGSNTWPETTVDTGTDVGQAATSIRLIGGDPDQIAIAYGHWGEDRLKYAHNFGGAGWVNEQIRQETFGRDTRGAELDFDSQGHPHVVYQEDDTDRTDNAIGYAERTSGSWTDYPIDTGGVGGIHQLVDSANKRHIYYLKLVNTTTKHLLHRQILVAPVCDAGGPYTGDAGVALAFTGSGSDLDGNIASWAWEFGDGGTGTGMSPSYTYSSPGDYTVTLTVTDDDGEEATATATATIAGGDAPPVCDAAGPYTGDANQPVTFNGSGSSDPDGTIATWDWNFGDGASGSGEFPDHTYGAAGTYTVTLTVTDNDAMTASCSTTATINPGQLDPPECNADGPYSGNVGSPVSFDGSGSSDPDGFVAGFSWNFGDGETGSGGLVQHTYTGAGTYTVTLTVTDNDDQMASCTSTATINGPPLCDADGTYSGQVNQDIVFDGSGSTDPDGVIASYLWVFGDGATAGGVSPTHAYATSGSFTVTLCVTDDGGLESCCATSANVAEDPPPVCMAGGPYAGFPNTDIALDASGSSDNGSIVAYAWEFGDGATGTGEMVTHSYAATGTFTVTLCVTDNESSEVCCATTVTVSAEAPEVTPPVVAASGGDLVLTLSTPATVDALAGEFRVGGTSAFVAFDPFAPTTAGDTTTWRATLPAGTNPARGIEFFIDYSVGDQDFQLGSAAAPERVAGEVTESGARLAAREFRMVATPIVPGSGSSISQVLSNFFGEPSDRTWRLGRWNDALDRYQSVDELNQPMRPGEAYWLVTQAGQSWSHTGDAHFPNAQGFFEVPLAPGWTMVGNPAAYRVTLRSTALRIADTDTLTFEAAATAGDPLVARGIKVFDAQINGPDKYFDGSFLNPQSGGWVFNRTPRTLTLLIPATEDRGRPAPPAAAPSLEKGWTVLIDATSGGSIARVELGAQVEAKVGYDWRDDYAPPPPPGVTFALGSRLDDAERRALLQRDLRPANQANHTWELEVASDEPVQLSWTAERAPADWAFEIEGDGLTYAMAAVRSLSLGAGRHILRVRAERGATPPAAPPAHLWAAVRPNPFRGATSLDFATPAAGQVTLRIFDVQGRAVWHAAERVDAGGHAVVWPAIDRRGASVPAGRYFLRVEYLGDAGRRQVASQAITVVR